MPSIVAVENCLHDKAPLEAALVLSVRLPEVPEQSAAAREILDLFARIEPGETHRLYLLN